MNKGINIDLLDDIDLSLSRSCYTLHVSNCNYLGYKNMSYIYIYPMSMVILY